MEAVAGRLGRSLSAAAMLLTLAAPSIAQEVPQASVLPPSPSATATPVASTGGDALGASADAPGTSGDASSASGEGVAAPTAGAGGNLPGASGEVGATGGDAAAAAKPVPDGYRTAHVTYLTATSAYLDAGSDEGLGPKMRVEVVRDGAVVAVLEVAYLSPHRSDCTIVQGADAVHVGDVARFAPGAPAAGEAATPGEGGASGAAGPAPAAAAAGEQGEAGAAGESATPAGQGATGPPARSAAASAKGSRQGLPHGRVGVRYLAVQDRGDTEAAYSQPSVDLRLDGSGLGGSPLGLHVDARARRTYQTFADGREDDEGRTRIYALNLSWNDGGTPVRATLGRQASPALATISIFDGVSVEYATPRWSMGGLGGTQPDAVDFGYSSDIREYGVYHQVRGAPGSPHNWELTTGLIGSYEQSEINREFLYLQGRYNGPKLSIFGTEEIDYNRGWKVSEAGESTISPTSTFLSLNWRPSRIVTVRAGYDNRRNVRLYRDRITPVTEFDDATRVGVWAGASFRLGDRFDLGLDGRRSDGGDAGQANAATLSFGANRIARVLAFHARSTRYDNPIEKGWLHALDVDVAVESRVNIGVSGGLRSVTPVDPLAPADDLTWVGLDLDVGLGRSWYALLSLERSSGDQESSDQAYAAVTYRF